MNLPRGDRLAAGELANHFAVLAEDIHGNLARRGDVDGNRHADGCLLCRGGQGLFHGRVAGFQIARGAELDAAPRAPVQEREIARIARINSVDRIEPGGVLPVNCPDADHAGSGRERVFSARNVQCAPRQAGLHEILIFAFADYGSAAGRVGHLAQVAPMQATVQDIDVRRAGLRVLPEGNVTNPIGPVRRILHVERRRPGRVGTKPQLDTIPGPELLQRAMGIHHFAVRQADAGIDIQGVGVVVERHAGVQLPGQLRRHPDRLGSRQIPARIAAVEGGRPLRRRHGNHEAVAQIGCPGANRPGEKCHKRERRQRCEPSSTQAQGEGLQDIGNHTAK